MPLPLLLMLGGVALNDLQQRQGLERQKEAMRTSGERAIEQNQIESTFGRSANPYPAMQADLEGRLDAADREMRARSNNHIGEMLQSYLSQPGAKGDVPKEGLIGGGTTDSLLDPWADGSPGPSVVSGVPGATRSALDDVDDLFGNESTNLLGGW